VKVLLDTNVLIAAFIARGTCAEVFEHCVRQHTLIGCDYLLEEFERILIRKFHYSRKDAVQAKTLLMERLVLVEPKPIEKAACRDASDLPILGAAHAAACDCLITGDRDLLDLRMFEKIPILAPSQFWKFEHARQKAEP